MSGEDMNKNRARIRMALWLLLFYLITLAEGFLTFPFIGHEHSWQNVVYGLIVAAPLWVSILAFLKAVRKETVDQEKS